VSAPLARLSAREAAIDVLCELDDDGEEFARALQKRLPSPDLRPGERRRLRAALRRSGLARAMRNVAWWLNFDRRVQRAGRGRKGAPARDQLRAALCEARALACPRNPRRAAAVVALLLLLHGLDHHTRVWPVRGPAPTGRARVRWLADRVRRLTDSGEGQYAARRS
jgi:hypothetical protein